MNDLHNAKVTVLGLGLHGGGVESVRYLARHGARVTVTDMKPAERLAASIAAIEGLTERQRFGGHDAEDMRSADFVVKNPALPRRAEILAHARRIETDISLFLARFNGTLVAVTGSKGKSSVSSLIHAGLKTEHPYARLGGNITVSPLSFIDEMVPDAPVVLELSSFQLGDLALCGSVRSGTVSLHPRVAVITNIFADHQNYYNDDMDAYVRDKEYIFASGTEDDVLVIGSEEPWTSRFKARARGRVVHVPPEGNPRQQNIRLAEVALEALGVSGPQVREALEAFPGLEHRLEYVTTREDVRYYNDSASTVPEATAGALQAIGAQQTVLITGGTDKHLDLSGFADHVRDARAIVLLSGSATERMRAILEARGIRYFGPFDELRDALMQANTLASPGNAVVFSPAAASFELFENEFARGREFKRLVDALPHPL